jgi:RNA polymerase sigma factor (sigma-70 family)
MDEDQLIAGCKESELRCQKALYERLHPKMLGVCLRYAIDRDQAQDMLQDGFIKVFMKIKDFNSKGSFEGWVRKIMVNTALEHLRKAKGRETVSFENESVLVVEKSPSAQDQLEAQDVLSIIQQLPMGYRTVFNLFAIEGYSHEEIAKELNISVNTSYSQYHRAKSMLQRMLGSEKKTPIKAAI